MESPTGRRTRNGILGGIQHAPPPAAQASAGAEGSQAVAAGDAGMCTDKKGPDSRSLDDVDLVGMWSREARWGGHVTENGYVFC